MTSAPPKDREVEAAKRRARAASASPPEAAAQAGRVEQEIEIEAR